MVNSEPPVAHTILIVDDEHSIRKALREYLEAWGYRVREAGNAEEARASLALGGCDLVTLDLGLGSSDGLDLAREIKSASDLPIIIITARADEVDRVVGLELGADDYVTKPFAMRELLARVRAVLRRSQRSNAVSAVPIIGEVCFSEFTLDKDARLVRRLTGETVTLTAGEFALLLVFLDRPGRVLSRNELLDLTNPNDSAAFDRSIDTLVSRLRKKLMSAAGSSEIFKTVRGMGYMLSVSVTRPTARGNCSRNWTQSVPRKCCVAPPRNNRDTRQTNVSHAAVMRRQDMRRPVLSWVMSNPARSAFSHTLLIHSRLKTLRLSKMTRTFEFYQAELARLQSALEAFSGREHDEKVSALRDQFFDEISALANEIVDLRCRDLRELRAKMLFVRELCDPSNIDGALVFSLCRDIEGMLGGIENTRAKQW